MIQFKAKDAAGEIIKSALTPFTFPAGEAHIKREERRDLERTEIAVIQPDAESIHDDLFLLGMWNDYLVRENLDLNQTPDLRSKRVLVLPYMPGARADRGMPFGLDVYANFLRRLDLDQIIIFDPHSGVTGDTLHAAAEELTFVYSDDFFRQPTARSLLTYYTGIIAPDKGAVRRASAIADLAGLPLFTATKHRDEASGKLSGFQIDGLSATGHYLIVDDICDGGGTFLGLAEASGLPYGHLSLYVSHGVFSKNALNTLSNTFSEVITTNSYNPRRPLAPETDLHPNVFIRLDVINLLLERIK